MAMLSIFWDSILRKYFDISHERLNNFSLTFSFS